MKYILPENIQTGEVESPSTRREWIEMLGVIVGVSVTGTSPSTRREWIEIILRQQVAIRTHRVSLHTVGVD